MTWTFDQARNVACITCRSVIDGAPVLSVTHYEDDHSWAFLDGVEFDPAESLVAAMATVVDRHPELREIASLPPGWSANRGAVGASWVMIEDDWGA